MWQQLVTAGIVGNNLFLCLGNGGDFNSIFSNSATDQSGLIVFGYADSVVLSGSSLGESDHEITHL